MIESIEWGSVSDFVSMLATVGAFIVGCCAFSTWKAQIKLQDRYAKADDLLKSYIELMKAGHDMHFHRFGSKADLLLHETEWYRVWQEALFKYRGTYRLAQSLFSSEFQEGNSLEPSQIGNGVLALSKLVHDHDVIGFCAEISSLQEDGIVAIQRFKQG